MTTISKHTKKIIVLDMSTHRGRLGNQLLQHVCLYAYAKERGYDIENYSFFRYARFFPNMQASISNPLINLFFFSAWGRNRLFRKIGLYTIYSRIMRFVCARRVFSEGDQVFFLPPTPNTNEQQRSLIDKIERSPARTIYIIGWLWRNPIGSTKYRAELRTILAPDPVVATAVQSRLSAYRKTAQHIIGVHIRMGDTRLKKQAQYVPPEGFPPVMREYLTFKGYDIEDTLFLICSDEDIDPKIFGNLRVAINGKDPAFPYNKSQPAFMDDLYALAATDEIIAAHSTFSAFSSYIADIPLFIVDNMPIDWDYYRGRSRYFENKYCVMAHYEH